MVFLNYLKFLGLFVLIFFVTVQSSCAQYSESLSSDRPGQALSANTVGKGIFQWQMGLEYAGASFKDLEAYDKVFVNSNNLRYGLFERFEVGLDVVSETAWYKEFYLPNRGEPKSSTSFGVNARVNVLKGAGVKPTIGVQLALQKLGENDEVFEPQLMLATSQTFWDTWGLATNLGVKNNNGSDYNSVIYAINMNKTFKRKLTVFLEHYSEIKNNEWQNKFDGGASYMINSNFQIDLYGGWYKKDYTFLSPDPYDPLLYQLPNPIQVTNWFISTGFTWRIGKHGSTE